MHFIRGIKNAGQFLEFSIEGEDYYPWQKGIFSSDPFEIKNGELEISDAPGWGVDFNEEWLEKADYVCLSNED